MHHKIPLPPATGLRQTPWPDIPHLLERLFQQHLHRPLLSSLVVVGLVGLGRYLLNGLIPFGTTEESASAETAGNLAQTIGETLTGQADQPAAIRMHERQRALLGHLLLTVLFACGGIFLLIEGNDRGRPSRVWLDAPGCAVIRQAGLQPEEDPGSCHLKTYLRSSADPGRLTLETADVSVEIGNIHVIGRRDESDFTLSLPAARLQRVMIGCGLLILALAVVIRAIYRHRQLVRSDDR